MRPAVAAIILLLLLSCGGQQETDRNSDSSAYDSLMHDSLVNDSASHNPVAPEPRLKDSAFVPPHYRVADVTFGNLNLDSFPDAIVMMRHDSDDVAMFSEMPRWIYILLGTAGGGYEVKVKNKNATFAQQEGQMFGDPYDGIEIDSGTFTINHYGGSRYRWTSNYVFEYDASTAEWYYTRHYSSDMDMLMEDTITYRDSLIVKSRIAFSKFNYASAPYSVAAD